MKKQNLKISGKFTFCSFGEKNQGYGDNKIMPSLGYTCLHAFNYILELPQIMWEEQAT